MRDHELIVIEDFKGLWQRGDLETCPLDHFTDCENVVFQESAVLVRNGVGPLLDAASALGNVLRIYNFTMQTGDSLLVLTDDGVIHHVVSTVLVHTVLTIVAMTDFGFVAFAGRAYITPYNSTTDSKGMKNQIGIDGEFLYVYKGDGTVARKAAGAPPSGGALIATPGAGTFSDLGFHIFAVVYETDTGYLTALGPEIFATATSVSEIQGYTISNIPVSPDTFVTKRHIVATKTIPFYNQDQDGYQFYFVPEGNIDDNVTTVKVVSFFDLDLLSDASHLIDNFEEVPAGVALGLFGSRMVLTTEFDNISLARLSAPGEPEAFDQVDGLVIIPLDGTPITNIQEFRGLLYIYKKNQTFVVSDNEDEPSTWIVINVDNGIGCEVHGIGQILDSGGVNADFVLVCGYAGIFLFNGTYARPELSYKVLDLWNAQDKNNFQRVQVVIDAIHQVIYMCLTDGRVLFGDFSEGINPKSIKWGKWSYNTKVSSLAITETDKLIVGTNNEILV